MRKNKRASGCSAFMRWYCCMAGVRAALVATDIGLEEPRLSPRRTRPSPAQPKKTSASANCSRSICFGPAVASLRGTASMRVPWRATIWPKRPSRTRSTARRPKRVPMIRSNAVGEPPRWMWQRTVTRVPHDVHGGVEADRVVGALEVVVDRLRHPDDRHPQLVQLAGRRQRPVSAHGDEGVEAVALEVVEELLPVFHHAQRVIAGRA